MEKQALADQLRQRQYALGQVTKEMIDSLTNDEIIDCYITCDCCDKKQVDCEDLADAIQKAKDAEHFFRICNAKEIKRLALQQHFEKQ